MTVFCILLFYMHATSDVLDVRDFILFFFSIEKVDCALMLVASNVYKGQGECCSSNV